MYRPLLFHVKALQTKPLTVFRQLGFDLWQGFAGGFFAQFDGLVALVKAADCAQFLHLRRDDDVGFFQLIVEGGHAHDVEALV